MKCEACGHENKPKRASKAKYLSETDFDMFWRTYPRKIGKFLALKVWKKIPAEPFLADNIVLAVERQRRSQAWQKDDGVYIPHASTWLNQRRWEDEVAENGQNVRPGSILTPHDEEKQRLANERIERLKEIEWAKREAKRHAQVRDDLRSQKMMKATGDEDWEIEAPKKVVVPEEIKQCVDENGNPFVVELERSYADAE